MGLHSHDRLLHFGSSLKFSFQQNMENNSFSVRFFSTFSDLLILTLLVPGGPGWLRQHKIHWTDCLPQYCRTRLAIIAAPYRPDSEPNLFVELQPIGSRCHAASILPSDSGNLHKK